MSRTEDWKLIEWYQEKMPSKMVCRKCNWLLHAHIKGDSVGTRCLSCGVFVEFTSEMLSKLFWVKKMESDHNANNSN